MSHKLSTASAFPIYEHEKGVYAKSTQSLVVHTYPEFMRKSVGSQAPANLNARARFEQKIPKGSGMDALRKLYLEFTITNSDGSAATLLPYYYIIDYINIRFGKEVWGPWNGELLYLNYCLQNDINTITVNSAATNISSSYTTVGNLSAAASATVILDLTTIIESFHGLLPDGFKEDITIEVTTRPSSEFCTSSTPDITCSSFHFIYGHESFATQEKEYRKHLHLNKKFVYKCLFPVQYKANFTCTAGQTYTDTIKSIIGTNNFFLCFLRPQGATGTDLDGFVSLTNLYFKDAGGRTLGDHQWSGAFLKQWATEHFTNNAFLGSFNVYPVIFSKSPIHSLTTGATTGGIDFTGQSEAVYFVPGAGSSTAYELVIYGFTYYTMTVDHGVVNFEREV